ncbi:MAG: rRNA pseudouridine synthase [Candidatus Cloacimonetes bacterium]|nr:rRNA pseudouridine synthase [Candidatus Cloacimonadota bacterium]
MRINKFLAQAGLGSRRACEKFVLEGKIKINGKIITNLATDIDPEKDKITFEDKLLKTTQRKIYLILNKPSGYLVTSSDPFKRKTVLDLVPIFPERIFPIGRLDKSSCGLMILTNDGDLTNKIMHPKKKIPKVYLVKVKGILSQSQINKLRYGVILNDNRTLPAKVYIKSYNQSNDITKLRMILYEGRNRQIRRMIKEIGNRVISLKRVQIGVIKLGRLPEGHWRFLKYKEIKHLYEMSGLDKNH